MTAWPNPEVERAVTRLVEVYGEQCDVLEFLLVLLTDPDVTVPDPESPDLVLAVLPIGLVKHIAEVLARTM